MTDIWHGWQLLWFILSKGRLKIWFDVCFVNRTLWEGGKFLLKYSFVLLHCADLLRAVFGSLPKIRGWMYLCCQLSHVAVQAGGMEEGRSPAESEVSWWPNQLSYMCESVICLQRSGVAEGAFHTIWACFLSLIFSVFHNQTCCFRTNESFATGVPCGMVSEQWRGSGVSGSVAKYQSNKPRLLTLWNHVKLISFPLGKGYLQHMGFLGILPSSWVKPN